MEQRALRRKRPASPRDFARRLAREFHKRDLDGPTETTLIDLCEAMYYASLRTEESEAIAFSVVYMDPREPDPSPPERIVRDRWSPIRLNNPIPATDANFAKLAQASDPRTSSFAVYGRPRRKLTIWGLIDQQTQYHRYLSHDSSSGPERPGVFEISILGAAHLRVSVDYEVIAELRVNVLADPEVDVIASGAVHRKLSPGVKRYVSAIKRASPRVAFKDRPEWAATLQSDYLAVIRRLLLRIKNLGHGGAVLVSPDSSYDNLDIKYKISYSRLKKAIRARGVSAVDNTFVGDEIWKFVEKERDIPIDLYLRESVSRSEVEESDSEIDGVLWFVALLSRVDGAVLLTPELDVVGFGVEITVSEEPHNVLLAQTPAASRSKVKALDYHHFGTRHRSMMRYCNHVDQSVGFVISQDGDVRAMTQRRNNLLVWDNIQLRHM